MPWEKIEMNFSVFRTKDFLFASSSRCQLFRLNSFSFFLHFLLCGGERPVEDASSQIIATREDQTSCDCSLSELLPGVPEAYSLW